MSPLLPNTESPVSGIDRKITALKYIASAVLLAASVALAGKTARAVRRADTSLPTSVVQFPDAAERDRRYRDVIGTFATGNEPGDRVILVQPDGRIRFYPVGPLQSALEFNDSFTLARRGSQACLVTLSNGVVETLDIDRLTYCGDEYRRTKSGSPNNR